MNKEGWVYIIGTGIFLATVFLGIIFFDSFTCSRKWSQFNTQWDLFAGCRVQIEGKYIPEKNVRQF